MALTYSLLYIILAAVVIILSIKLADYVDLIDKKTNISGAFIGGVILAAITSLPELFTSISAIVVVNQPDMIIGNILGSNIFNMTILGFLMIFMCKKFSKSVVGISHLKTSILTLVLFAMMFFAIFLEFDFNIWSISIYSIIIAVLYGFSIKFMASDDASEEREDTSKLTLKTIIILFIVMAILLVAASIGITYVTDKLAAELNLGVTLAGALFLGIATSLPELTSCFALAKKGNFSACVGNILGSGIFNFFILTIGDIIYNKGSIYNSNTQSKSLVVFGTISIFLVTITLFIKTNQQKDSRTTNIIYRILGIGIIACYVLFIALS